ncbi:MAG: GNAT family N-acetyltransferase [Lutibacter sp.]
MNTSSLIIRNAKPEEFAAVGNLMVNVYKNLEGFPSPKEQPEYYKMLQNVGTLTKNHLTELFVAVNIENKILGVVLYLGDMKFYGAHDITKNESLASGFRLLAVSQEARGLGVGKKLVHHCINKAIKQECKQVIIHSTESMKIAWKMYKKMGFKRAKELDFYQDKLPVFGFRLSI